MPIQGSGRSRLARRNALPWFFLALTCLALVAIPPASQAAPTPAARPLPARSAPVSIQASPVALSATAPVSGTWQTIGDVPPTLGRIEHLLTAPDGDLYLNGGMLELDGQLRSGLFRRRAGIWSQIAAYADPTSIKALAWGHDSLYVAGDFSAIEGVPADHLARWDGQQWSAVGSGFTALADSDPLISDLAFDQGVLYIAGWFDTFNGVPVRNLARWDGTTASAFGDIQYVWGVDAANGKVYVQGSEMFGWDGSQWFSMAAGWPGNWSGASLASGGRVLSTSATQVLEWTGSQWVPLGAALAMKGRVSDLALIGNVLYAGIKYPYPADQPPHADALHRWDGTAWQEIAPEFGQVTALAAGQDGLYIGATAQRLNTLESSLWRWDGTDLQSLGLPLTALPKVSRLAAASDGVYTQLSYDVTAEYTATSLLRWQDGAWSEAWRTFTPPIPGASLGPIDVGEDGRLYAVTRLSNYREQVVRYDNGAWITMTEQLLPAIEDSGYQLSSLQVISPTAIYAFGDYIISSPPERAVTAFWDGDSWSSKIFDHSPYEERVHSGQECGDRYYVLMTPVRWSDTPRPTDIYEVNRETGQYTLVDGYAGGVSAVTAFACLGDDLYLAGALGMRTVGSEVESYDRLVRWNGAASEVISVTGHISALTVRDGMLYAGGRFTAIDGVAANNIARWNDTEWQALGAGVTGPNADPNSGSVTHLTFFGDKLYVGGAFASAGGQLAQSLAIWQEDDVIVVPPPTRLFLPMLSR